MEKILAAITGVAGYVPDYVLTNAELETMVDTNDEWIVARTGIRERRILKGENMGPSHMAIPAVQELLKKTNTNPEDVELLICCTTTSDFVFPATGNLIAAGVGLVNAFSYDLQAACCGFLFGLTAGAQYIESGRYKKVIVVGADKMSSIVDYTDRTTCIIFGDAAAAVMLEPSKEFGIIDFVSRSDGSGLDFLQMKAGGSRNPPSHASVDAKHHVVYQEGAVVFKHAVTNMGEITAKLMDQNNLTNDNVAWLVPHQANNRIIQATAARVGMPIEKVTINIDRYGNTTNATIPLCLWEYEHKFKKGDNLVLTAFGGGFTWGAIYLKWAYDTEKA